MATDSGLRGLIHDINAKCWNLKTAAEILHGKPPAEELRLLKLMKDQSRVLADKIAAYEAHRSELLKD